MVIIIIIIDMRLCQEKCVSYFPNLHTLFYKLQSAVLLLLEGLLFTQNFMGCLISISATVNLHGGCFDGYILKKMLTAAEISSVSVTASYICFPTNISVLQQNKRQLNLLPLVNIIFPFFRVTPTIDIEPNIIAVLPLHAMIIAIYFITFPIHSFS
ncbi:hypothetical protein [Ruminococcus bromii]|uniref:hypothetical protein n=1 Tax=Ruminococcus bromii TaxID=40518 RepID=UPI003AB402EA